MVRDHVSGPGITLVNKKGRYAEKGKIPDNITPDILSELQLIKLYTSAGSGADRSEPLCSGVTDGHPCYYTIENCVDHLHIEQLHDRPSVDMTRIDKTRTRTKVKKVGRLAGSAHRNYPDKR